MRRWTAVLLGAAVLAVVACSGDDTAESPASTASSSSTTTTTTTRPTTTTARPTTTTTAPTMRRDLVVELAFGRVDLDLKSTRLVAAEGVSATLPGAPWLCATLEVRNIGRTDASVDVTQFRAVSPSGQINATSAAGAVATGASSLRVQLVPGGSGQVEPCFDTNGQTGSFEVQYAPTTPPLATWPVEV